LNYPVYTAIAGSFLLGLQLVLMMSTGLHRARNKIFIGAGDDDNMLRKSRRHANLTENAPMFVVMLALLELLKGQVTSVLFLACVFVAARLFHALGFSSLAGSHDPAKGWLIFPVMRGIGAFGTAMSGIALSVYLIYVLLGFSAT